MDVFDLAAVLSLDTSKYENGLTKAKTSASTFGGALSSGLGTAAKLGAAAVVAVGTAAIGVSTAMVKGTADVAEYGDTIDKESQKLGISAEAYQEWDAVLQHTGGSIDNLKPALKTLSKEIVNNSDAFQQLGISQEEMKKSSVEEVLAMTIAKLQEMPPGVERTRLATQLLGKSSVELGALLNTSAAETQAMKDRLHELGGVMSDESVKAAAHYQDTLQDMTTAFSGLKRGLISEFLPSVTTVMEGLTDLFSGDESGINKINDGISDFTDKLAASLPKVLDTGAKIITSLVTAISKNLPQLFKAGADALGIFISGVIENIPMILDAAADLMNQFADALENFDFAGAAANLGQKIVELFDPKEGTITKIISAAFRIIENLAKGLGEAAPELIPAAINTIIDLIISILENVDALVDGAIALVTGLADGIINALPILIDRLPEIIVKITETLILSAPKLMMAGPEIMLALVTGILDSLPELIAMGPKLVGELLTALINDAPKLTETGTNFIEHMIEGITQMIPTLLTLPAEIIAQYMLALATEGKKLIDSGKELGENIKEGIYEFVDNAIEWGRDLIDNFAAGIDERISYVKKTIEDLADAVSDLIGFSEPEKGPLSNFHTYAPDMMKLFAKGIRDNTDIVTDQIEKSFDFNNLITDNDIQSSSVNMTSGNNRLTADNFVQNLTINSPKQLDPSEIARQTRNANREFVLQLRTV